MMNLSGILHLPAKKTLISISGGGGKTTTLFTLADELKQNKVLITTTTKILIPPISESYDLIIEENSENLIRKLKNAPTKNVIVCGSPVEGDHRKLRGYSPEVIEQIKEYFDYIIIESDGSAGRPVKAPAGHEPVICGSTDVHIAVIGLDCIGRRGTGEIVHRPELFSRIRNKEESELITADDLLKLANAPSGLFKNAPDNCRRVILLNKADTISEETGKRIMEHLVRASNHPVLVILNSFRKKDSVIDFSRSGIDYI